MWIGVGGALPFNSGGDVTQKDSTSNYLGAHVGWKTAKAFDTEARRRGKKRSWLIARVLTLVAQDQIWNAVIGEHEEKRKP